MTNDTKPEDTVNMKTLYVKFLYLKDKAKHPNDPILYKPIGNSNKMEPLYDMAVFNAFTHFGFNEEQEKLCKKTILDTRNQLKNPTHADQRAPSTVTPSYGNLTTKSLGDLNDAEFYPGKSPKNSIWKLTPFHNSFQKENEDDREWAGVGADFFTEEINLIVDFSSLIKSDSVNDLFVKKPVAFWERTQKEGFEDDVSEKKPIDITSTNGLLFFVSGKEIPKSDILRIEWKINWDLLDDLVIL